MSTKQTSLYTEHLSLGAKMVPFAGYMMPVQYEGIRAEHEAVRKAAGIFDVSHMGEFILKGAESEAFLQSVTSNDVSKLSDGQAQYSCLTNDRGGIVDDLLVYRIDGGTYMLVVNAANIEKDWNWLFEKKGSFPGFDLKNISERTALIAVQGPNAGAILQKLTELDLTTLAYYTFKKDRFAGVDNVLISATGYTGSGGFELYFEQQYAPEVWKKILAAGSNLGLKPAGLGSRDTLRLEMGFCLYGNDIDDETNPLEAGLGWITKFDKKFTASEFLESQKKNGTQKKLVGFELLERGVPRHGYSIQDETGNVIGEVTSGTHSPSLQKGIGMGYVALPYSKADTEIRILVRDQALKARVVKLPFYKK